MKIAVIGSGYVGLVSAVCFSEFGYQVTSVDIDPLKIETLNKGEMPLYEAGLQRLLKHNLEAKRIHFSTDISAAITGAKIIFLAVGTPMNAGTKQADLSYLFQAIDQICEVINEDKIIVIKSTVPIGTGDKISDYIAQKSLPHRCEIVSNPEFLREGSAVEDFMNPARVVLGSNHQAALDAVEKLYAPLALKNIPIIRTSSLTAEIIKYAANSFLATKITFINELADLSEKAGGDIKTISYAMGLDDRIGAQFLNPGPGYGGACFPKDCQALIDVAQMHQVNLNIVTSTHIANVNRKKNLIHRIQSIYPDLQNVPIAILGVTFKANTDDVRESPAFDLIHALNDAGAKLCVHDPQGLENAKAILKNKVAYCTSLQECVKSSKIIVIMTEWDEYKALDFAELKTHSQCETLFDFRNLYDPKTVNTYGLKYVSIGR